LEKTKFNFLYDPRVLAFKIYVDVDMGQVTLRGVVDSLKAKRSAEMDARHTAGVRWVKNYLKVRPANPLPDLQLEENVRNALQRDNLLERYEFTVSVINHLSVRSPGTLAMSSEEKKID
jgi:hypothetical protein